MIYKYRRIRLYSIDKEVVHGFLIPALFKLQRVIEEISLIRVTAVIWPVQKKITALLIKKLHKHLHVGVNRKTLIKGYVLKQRFIKNVCRKADMKSLGEHFKIDIIAAFQIKCHLERQSSYIFFFLFIHAVGCERNYITLCYRTHSRIKGVRRYDSVISDEHDAVSVRLFERKVICLRLGKL